MIGVHPIGAQLVFNTGLYLHCWCLPIFWIGTEYFSSSDLAWTEGRQLSAVGSNPGHQAFPKRKLEMLRPLKFHLLSEVFQIRISEHTLLCSDCPVMQIVHLVMHTAVTKCLFLSVLWCHFWTDAQTDKSKSMLVLQATRLKGSPQYAHVPTYDDAHKIRNKKHQSSSEII